MFTLMVNFLKNIIVMMFLCVLFANNACAETLYYTGTMKILETSGRACGSLAVKIYPVMLLKRQEKDGVYGYFEAESITLGKFSGNNLQALSVTYPYHDQERSSGHTLVLSEDGHKLSLILHDRHIEANVDECNFDHAVMTLNRKIDRLAESRFETLATRYEAQLLRSEAIDLSRKGQSYDAVLRYEKALKLIDRISPVSSSQRDSFSAALAGSYIRSDMTDEFTKLYNERFSTLKDEATRAIFTEYRMRILKKAARTAMQHEDFETAIRDYQQVFVLNKEDKVTIAALMAAYMRSERYGDAIAFLQQAEKGLQNKEDKVDVRGATAMALLKQSMKFDQSGKTAEAELSLKRAMEFDPDSPLYTIALARLRHKTTGSLSEAEKMLSQAENRFKDMSSRVLIGKGREKMRQIDAILKKINRTGS